MNRPSPALWPLAVVCAVLVVPSPAEAQGACGGNGRYHLRSAPASISYGPVTLSELENGEIVAGTVELRVTPRGKRQRDWTLCVAGPGPVFGPGGKAIEDIELRIAGGGAWQPVTADERFVVNGSGNARLAVTFRVAVDYADAPGSYVAPLTFRVARR